MLLNLVLKKTLESPLDSKEIKPVNPKGNQSWIFIGRTDTEAETPVLWPPDVKNCLIGKDPDAGKDWRQEEKGTTEDEMVGWHHRLDGREFWVNSGSWWWTGRPGVPRFMGSQRVGHDWATELNWNFLQKLEEILDVVSFDLIFTQYLSFHSQSKFPAWMVDIRDKSLPAMLSFLYWEILRLIANQIKDSFILILFFRNLLFNILFNIDKMKVEH